MRATFYLFGANLWWDKSNHPQLAAFFGMHLYPFVGALIGWLLLSHARNFKFHPWSTRVPGIMGLNHESGSREEKNWAALFLILLVAFPVYAQGHFLLQFHTEGHVYLYPRDFGFKPHEVQALIEPGDGLACLRGPLENGTAKCRHPTADLYRIAQPKPGYKAATGRTPITTVITAAAVGSRPASGRSFNRSSSLRCRFLRSY